MAKKTYQGSCHCKKIRFEADIDFAQEKTMKCNCTSCWKKRWWSVKVDPASFRALGGEENMSEYVPGEKKGHRGFCKSCGVLTYGWVPASEWNPTEYVSVSVASLDNLDPAELVEAPVWYMNGRDNDWWHVPAETRHL
jgi:hypothetical protein